MEKDPEDRYRSAGEFGEDLRRFLAGESTIVRVKGPVGRGWQRLRTTKSATLLVSAIALGLGWTAIDRLVLAPWVGGDAARLVWQAGALGMVALPLLALLAAAGSRLAPSRRLGVALGLMFGMGFAGADAWRLADRGTQIEMDAERGALDRSLTRGTRRDVADIEAFIARWEDRFELQDVMRVVRGYIKRDRVTRAREWVDELAAKDGHGLLSQTLVSIIADLTGEADRVPPGNVAGEHWHLLVLVGDVYGDIGRHSEAIAHYELAARDPDAPRELSLTIAGVLIDLCDYDGAATRLIEPRLDRPDDFVVQAVALELALGQGDVTLARELQARLGDIARENRDISWGLLEQKQMEYQLLLAEGRGDEALTLVETLADARSDDRDTLDWCARTMHGLQRFEDAEGIYQKLLELDPDSVAALVGMASTHDKPAYLAARQGQLSWADYLVGLEGDLTLLRRAVALDSSYVESHYNIAQLDRRRHRIAANVPFSQFSGEPLDRCIQDLEATIEAGGIRTEVLNDLAYFLGRRAEITGNEEDLQSAQRHIRSAIRHAQWDEASQCVEPQSSLETRAGLLDTLAVIQLAAGDCVGAGASIAEALEIVPPDSLRRPGFESTGQRVLDACR